VYLRLIYFWTGPKADREQKMAIGGTKVVDARFRIRIAKAAASDFSQSFDDSAQRRLAFLIRNVSTKGVVMPKAHARGSMPILARRSPCRKPGASTGTAT
jgi:hypothetical protein